MNIIRRLSLLIVTCSVLMLAGCASDGTQPDARTTANAQDDITQMHAIYLKAFNAKDASGVSNAYTEDAMLMPPNEPAVKSQVAILNYEKQMFASGPITGLLLNVNDTQVTNGWAFSSGYYTMLGAAGSTLDRGKFLEVLKQTDQGWKIYRDMFNSDMAPAGAPAAGTAMAPAAATH
jgi:ketosteroid isomerase-like protein